MLLRTSVVARQAQPDSPGMYPDSLRGVCRAYAEARGIPYTLNAGSQPNSSHHTATCSPPEHAGLLPMMPNHSMRAPATKRHATKTARAHEQRHIQFTHHKHKHHPRETAVVTKCMYTPAGLLLPRLTRVLVVSSPFFGRSTQLRQYTEMATTHYVLHRKQSLARLPLASVM